MASAKHVGAQVSATATSGPTSFEALDANSDGKLDKAEFLALAPEDGSEYDAAIFERLRQLYGRLFEVADLDHDGVLDEREAGYAEYLAEDAIAMRLLDYPIGEAWDVMHVTAEMYLEDADSDGDGKLSRDEYWRLLSESATEGGWTEGADDDPELRRWSEDLFAEADADGDGLWDVGEFRYASYLVEEDLRSGLLFERASAALAVNIFEDLDADKNGRIARSEVEAAAARHAGEVLVVARQTPVGVVAAVLEAFDAADTNGDGALVEAEVALLAAAMVRDEL